MVSTSYKQEENRYKNNLIETLTKLAKNTRYQIAVIKNKDYNHGVIFDKQLNATVTVCYDSYGFQLCYATKPNKISGCGYHIGGSVHPQTSNQKSNKHYNFIGELSEELLTDAIQYGNNLLKNDIKPYVYKNINDFLEYQLKRYNTVYELI